MADMTGFQVVGFGEGVSNKDGEDVIFKIRVNDGSKDRDLTLLLPEDLLAAFISHLITYGGMARKARLEANPQQETHGITGALTLGLADVIPGRSITDPRYAILTLQFDAGNDRKLNLYCTADADVLDTLSGACTQAAEMLQGDGLEALPH